MKYALTSLVSIAGILLLLHLTLGRDRLVPLVELTEAPRPPPHADRSSKPQLLDGLLDAPHEGEAGDENGLRRRRNELALLHADALAEWHAGRKSLREVEGIEQTLQVARWRVGEIDEHELHERLAELFEREVTRVEALAKSGLAGVDSLARARLHLARELYLAGRAATDPRAAGYPEARERYLADVRKRFLIEIDAGLAPREYTLDNLERLEQDFPPPPVPPPPPPAAAAAGAPGKGPSER